MYLFSKLTNVLFTKRIVKVYPKKTTNTNTITYTGTTGISTTTSVDVDTRVQYSPTSGFSTFKLV